MPAESSLLTIRRWIILIAIAAAYLGACHWAESWRPAFLHLNARAEYLRIRGIYDEGRVTCDRVLESSRCLMRAEFGLNGDHQSRIKAIEAHLKRIGGVVEIERRDLELCCRGGCADLAEAEQYLEEDEALLAREKGLGPTNPRDGRR